MAHGDAHMLPTQRTNEDSRFKMRTYLVVVVVAAFVDHESY